MARFVVQGSAPYCVRDDKEPSGFKKYFEGDEVESEQDLLKKFPNKFKLVTEQGQIVEVTPERRAKVLELIESGVWDKGAQAFLETLAPVNFANIERQSLMVRANQARAEAESKADVTAFGTDVTDRFQQAYDNGLKVFASTGGKFNVTKPGARKAINRSPLAEDAVEAFVAEYLKDMKR
jgi:hypothetical protein